MKSAQSGPGTGTSALLTVHDEDINVQIAAGHWERVVSSTPDAFLARCAGTAPDEFEIAVAGAELRHASAVARCRAGLGVATGRLPAIESLRVLDVILLDVRTPRPSLWRTMLGGARVRAAVADEQAAARALAGRTGLASWVDRPASALPADVTALIDVTRAVAANPRALVWRRPQWLFSVDQERIADVVAAEQSAAGFAVLEVVAPAAGSLPQP